MKTLIAALIAVAASMAFPAYGQIINVQFSNYANGTYAGTGADADDTGTSWNYLTDPSRTGAASAINLVNQSGTATSVDISTTQSGSSTLGSTSSSLFNGYFASYSNTTSSTVTLSGLNDNQSFTLYVYSQGGTSNTGRPATFTLAAANGGATASTLSTADSSSFVLGQNYVELTGETSSTGTLTLDYVRSGSSNSEADLNGFQLELGAVVPEPPTWAMTLVGLGLLLQSRRLLRLKA